MISDEGMPDLWVVAAIVPAARVDAVERALGATPRVRGIQVMECDVRKEGAQPMRRIEVVVRGRPHAKSAADAIALAAHTGSPDDGEVLMWQLALILDIGSFRINEDVR